MSEPCPTRAQLDSFQAGDLDEAALTAVASHVESCPNCQRSLETIIGDSADTVLAALLEEAEPSPFAAEPACRVAIERVAALAGSATSDSESSPTTIVLRGAPIVAVEEPLPLETIREYKLLAKLGEGGMGTVYKALHTRLDKVVALKVLPEGRMRDGGSVARFQREMKAVGRLDHPNIVRAMDAGDEDGTHFLVMEYVEGADLSQLAKNIGPLPVADACELIRQAALGLQEAHEHSMVHRDIKPSNLILAKSARKKSPPTLKILDLGLALLTEALLPDHQGLTYTGQMMGTIDYMAPEQGSDTHHVDIRADIYSLGATLYKLLTGSVPFAGEKFDTPVKKILALATQEPQAVRSRRADVPPPLADIVHKMLAKDPAERYATPDELIEALSPFCQGANLTALLERGTRPGQPNTSSSEAPTHPQLSSGSADTAPTIDRSIKAGTKSPSRFALAGFGRKIPRSVAIATASVGAALALLLGVVFYLQISKETTIRIEIIDPAIKVVLDENSATFEGVDKEHKIKVEPGEHGLTITRGNFKFITDKFELRKRETLRLSVTYLAGEVRVVRADGSPLKVVSATLPAAPPTSTGYALKFDGEDYIEIPTFRFDGSHPFTFEATLADHYRQDQTGTAIFSSIHSESGVRFGTTVSLVNHGVDLTRRANEIHASCGAGDSCTIFKAAGRPRSEELINLAAVYDQGNWRIFVNGKHVTESSFPFPGGLSIVKGSFARIGSYVVQKPNESRGYIGVMQEVRISRVARYAVNYDPPARLAADVDTYLLYQMGEGQGDVLKDSSGNNHHGKIVGAKWVKAERPTDTPPLAIAPFDATQARTHQEAWAKYLGLPVKATNSVGAKMILIPPGAFVMGSNEEQIAAALKVAAAEGTDRVTKSRLQKAERPQHRVVISKPLRMGATEVTVGQFRQFVDAAKYVTEAEQHGFGNSDGKVLNDKVPQSNRGVSWRAPGYAVSDDLPVTQVTWSDARAYCQWLSTHESQAGERITYRLPTEAEWEYACRAGTTTQYSFGNDVKLLDQFAWYGRNAADKVHPVGFKVPNGFGLFDMHGNLWEWSGDYYDEKWYETSSSNDPQGPATGTIRALRGGDWGYVASICRSASRYYHTPLSRTNFVGFRVVRTLDAPTTTLTPRVAILPSDSTTAPDHVVDLLKLVDVERDSVKGKWTLSANGLASDGSVAHCRLKLPYAPPPEYDFRVEFTAQGGNDILQLLTAGGHDFSWLMGAWGGRYDGFDTVKDHPLTREGTNILGGPTSIRRGQRHVSVIQVRRDSIAATIDGKLVVRHATDGSDLGIPGPWSIGEGAIGLGTTFDAVVFHKVELVVPAVVDEGSGWHGWPKDDAAPAIAPFDAQQAKKHQEDWAQHLGVPVDHENSIGMKFVLIPPGEFTMGSTEAEIEAALKVPNSNEWAKEYVRTESPQHKVVLTQPFYLGVHEVTQEQFEKVTGANPSHFSPSGTGKNDFGGMDRTHCPVENIRWIDAADFCTKLSQREKQKPFYLSSGETVTPVEGFSYRLPTEAQWEFACRAGTTTRFWTGDSDEDLLQAAWFKGNSKGLPNPVGTLKPNPFGLYDVHGNIWEWVHDWWEPTYYGQFKDKAAVDPSGPSAAPTVRMLRGGNWSFTASDCRSSGRAAGEPAPQYRSTGQGFRVALSVDAVKAAIAEHKP